MIPISYVFNNFDITIYKFKKYENTISGYQVRVICTLEGKQYDRVYGVEQEIASIVIEGEYLYLNDSDENQYIIKIEGDSCLVIDTFDNRGEHQEVIGCHDFWDDVT